MGILKIGVVGCGRIGTLHINNLINSVPGVQVVAAADPMLDKSGAREWLAERKITNVSTDFMDVINNPEVDVVFVCSSTDTHCDVSMAAVQAGKHVFCEKPIDYDIEKIKKLLGAKRFNVRQRMQNIAAADRTQLRAECFCFAESGIGLVTGG